MKLTERIAHYIGHVEGAHDGLPLPGAVSLNAARLLLLEGVAER